MPPSTASVSVVPTVMSVTLHCSQDCELIVLQAIVESPAQYLKDLAEKDISAATTTKHQLMLLSAHHADSLNETAKKTFEYIKTNPDRVPDLSLTLGTRRDKLAHRAFAIVGDDEEPQISPLVKAKEAPSVYMVFTGQGAQWPQMGADLMEAYPCFLKDIREMDKALQALASPPPWNIESELKKGKEESQIQQPEFSQPICTALQIGLVNLLKSWGIKPAAVVGHSSGEIGAAYAVGALTMEMSMAIAYYRGQITQQHGRSGGMAAVSLSREAATAYLKEGVGIACENSPKNVTLSGDNDKLDEVLAQIKADDPDCFARRLRVERAYHSHHMKEIGDMYEKTLEGLVKDTKPTAPLFSSVTVKQIKRAGNLGPAYWRSNLENPVQFSPAVQLMLHAAPKDSVFLEVGPHAALAGPIRDTFKAVQLPTAATYVGTLMRGESGVKSLLTSLGRLFQENVSYDFAASTIGQKVLTDLPNYSWKHDTVYWDESRVTKEWRQRKFAPHELLGSRIMETDEFEPTWRNVLRLDTVPWARDHKIEDDIVLPAAAYISMACEAMTRLNGGEVRECSLRSIDIKSALVLKEDTAHEIVTHLRPVRLTTSLDSEWWDFSVSSYDGGAWVKHCTAQVRSGKQCSNTEESTKPQARSVHTAGWYRIMKRIGLNYGPEFQLMDDISAEPGQNHAAASVKNPRPDVSASSYQLHPSIIDQVLQAFTVAMADGLTRKFTKLCVPRYIEEIYIGKEGPNMRLGVSANARATGGIRGSATITSENGLALNLRGGEFTPLEGEIGDPEPVPAATLNWKRDVDFVAPVNLISAGKADREQKAKLEKLALLCSLETLRRTEGIEAPEHLKKFRNWLTSQKTKATEGKYEHVEDSARLAGLDQAGLVSEIESAAAAAGDAGKVFQRMALSSDAIFKGESEAAQVLAEEGGLDAVANAMSSNVDYSQYLELIAHSNPTIHVLEIGASNGGMTEKVIKGLHIDGERSYKRYVYTDASSDDSFEALKEKFKSYEKMDFKVLDLSKDAVEQGIEANGFDLVIASNALHNTASIKDAVANVKKVMKPGARLLIQELDPAYKMFNFINGFKSEFWLGAEDGRAEEPFVSSSRWETELREAGFSGNDALILDDETGFQVNTSIITTATAEIPSQREVSILTNNQEGPAKALNELLSQQGFKTSYTTFGDEPRSDADVISLLDLEEPFYHKMSEADFNKWQGFIGKFSDQSGMLWVTGHSQVGTKDPRYANAIGASRNIRSELSLDWATLEIDVNHFEAENIAVVYDKFRKRVKGSEFDPDWEYAVVDNKVMTPRYQWLNVHKKMEEESTGNNGDGPRNLVIGRMGQLGTLQWIEEKLAVLQPHEVEVEPRAVGLNFKDVLVAMGIVEGYRPGLGIECGGYVSRVGSDVKNVEPGDRVMIFGHGCFTTKFVTHADLAVPIPDDLSFEDAATIPCVYSTVIEALINIGNIQKGTSVLIHSACGGVGIAAINIAQAAGAEIYCTVGNADKVKYLQENFGIAKENIFNSRDASFHPDLMAATNNRGVDLVLNSLSGELLHVSWRCLAQFGKMLEIGKRDFIGKGQLAMDIFEGHRSFHGIDMSQVAVERPDMCQKILRQFNEYYARGDLKPIKPLKVFKATEVRDAFRYMQKGQHIGKIVVTMPEDPAEFGPSVKKQGAKFRSDASYLMVGGFGGLGKSVSNWMVENGARHLIFLSRSAGDSDADKSFIKELEHQGCGVQTIKGTVTDLESVKAGLAKAEKNIAGVFVLTMVLRDKGIMDLSHDDWFACADPKVVGAWNLHQALEGQDLEFFISFSSISYVVGQIGQANYSSANAYLAAFAQYRHSLGLPASVLNVGVMNDVGYVVENQALLDQFKALSFYILGEQELLDSISYQMAHQQPAKNAEGTFTNPAELAIGLKSTKPLADPQNRVVFKRDIRMAAAHLKDADDGDGAGGNEDLGQFMKNVHADPGMLNVEVNLEFLTRSIGECVYNLMSRPVDEYDPAMSLSGLGVDSLVSIEIRNWWRHTLGVNTSVLEIMGSSSIAMLGKLAADGITKLHATA